MEVQGGKEMVLIERHFRCEQLSVLSWFTKYVYCIGHPPWASLLGPVLSRGKE